MIKRMRDMMLGGLIIAGLITGTHHVLAQSDANDCQDCWPVANVTDQALDTNHDGTVTQDEYQGCDSLTTDQAIGQVFVDRAIQQVKLGRIVEVQELASLAAEYPDTAFNLAMAGFTPAEDDGLDGGDRSLIYDPTFNS